MSADLCGWRVDGGVSVPQAALQPRAWRQTAIASGVANKVVIKGFSDGQVRYAVYSNNPEGSNRPLSPLSWTDTIDVVAGEIKTVDLNAPVEIFEGEIYHHDFVQVGSAARLAGGTVSGTQRAQGAVVASIDDPFANPFSYATGATVTVAPYVMLISDSVGIGGIDKLNTAQTSIATFNADFAATSFSISDGETTKTAAATTVNSASASFVAPAWVDGETAVKIGPVTVTANDGTDTTTSFNDELEFWSGHPDNATVVKFTAVTLTSVDPDNIGAAHNFNFDPPLKVGTQVIFDSARFSVINGKVESADLEDYQGQSLFWFLDPDDHIARDFTLDTSEGAVAPVMPVDATINVYEGATTLGTFPAASGTSPISYALGGDDAALFTINSATAKVDPVGALTVGQSGVITVTPGNSTGTGDPQTINWSVIAVPDVDRGLTATALTAISLTMVGLTATGL